MADWIVYTGEREGSFSLNSRAVPGAKILIHHNAPFVISDGDQWITNLRGFVVLSVIDFTPSIDRLIGTDESYCSKWEGAFIEGLAASCPDPARVVEIGTGKGNSLLRILYGLSLHADARVWSIDLLECAETRAYVEKAHIASGRYTYLTGNSPELAEQIDEPIDLVFVDGSHNDTGVRADITAWAGKIKVGGVMAFHDYGNPLHEVSAAIDELMVTQWKRIGQIGTVIAFEKEAV